jgi:cytochrome c-type biogenesis protein CcmH/NrfF
MANGRARRYAARVTSRTPSLIAFGIVLCLGSMAACHTPESDAQRADAITAHTMSPFCPGRTLQSCPSPSAAEWRQDIRQWVDQGMSTQQIRQRLEARAATTDLSGTPSTRFGWALPVVLTALSLALLGVVLQRFRSTRDQQQLEASKSAAEADSPDLDRRLDRELSDLDPDRDD